MKSLSRRAAIPGWRRAQGRRIGCRHHRLKLPGLNGLDLVRQLHAAKPRLPIIMMTAHGTTESAIEATKAGAYDYLLKPFEMPESACARAKGITSRRMMTEPVELGAARATSAALVGNCRAMQAIYKEIGRIASKPVNVLIRGETGTGKELIARAIYQHSDRSKAPFIAINCAAIPETLLESELFGHERGAFTGAENRRIGRFEQADHGTIFLDEIGDMTPGTQVKLMRVLQERCLQRLGGKETIPVDVRVLAATHRDLESAIRSQAFPRRPLLPPQRGGHPPAALARAQGGHSRAGKILPAQTRRRAGRRRSLHSRRRHGVPVHAKAGPATCANWKTSSAKSCCWPRTTPSTSTTSAPPLTRAAPPAEAAHQTLARARGYLAGRRATRRIGRCP